MSTTPTQLSAKYRGAVVEDLQLPPALSLGLHTQVVEALSLAYDREFSRLPVLSDQRRLVGFVDIEFLKTKFAAGKIKEDETISPSNFTRFTTKSSASGPGPYQVITPLTPLAELEKFFEFKAGQEGGDFALVTDEKRRLVYAVVTKADLEKFVSRRSGNGGEAGPP
ncbi:hypothetical protein BDY24DRAFT_404708 [Mrakia frigida]|uniref:uncharacterized protein n=1 Tax=Mrakia frigida TaxID=29902 RepID=UPI003FCC17F4